MFDVIAMDKTILEYAQKYVVYIMGEADADPIVLDTLRRQTHDALARRLGCSTWLVKRAAMCLEHPYAAVMTDSELERRSKLFVRRLEDIAEMEEGKTDQEMSDFWAKRDKC